MEQNTTLSNTIELAKDKIRYDSAVKKLLSENILLAWIMKHCMKEYEHFSVEEIATKYINGTPEISTIPVEQDVEGVSQRVPSTGTEDASIQEGTITFDIKFHALVPTVQGVIRLIINLEAQNDYTPGYPLVTRGVYYSSRMISAQSGTVFFKSHYEKIQKVYSVWICTNPPKKHQNTITSYQMIENNVVGDVQQPAAFYDLINVMMICLGASEDTEYEVLKLLDVLLKDKISAEEKKKRLHEEFHIPMTQNIESEVGVMCNLSDGIEQRGIERGIERGETLKSIKIIKKQLQKQIQIDEIADLIEVENTFVLKVKSLLKQFPTLTNEELLGKLM
ncbi:MAG: hypothetical protein R3Y24_12745 [Eubacteriales bacterium]